MYILQIIHTYMYRIYIYIHVHIHVCVHVFLVGYQNPKMVLVGFYLDDVSSGKIMSRVVPAVPHQFWALCPPFFLRHEVSGRLLLPTFQHVAGHNDRLSSMYINPDLQY